MTSKLKRKDKDIVIPRKVLIEIISMAHHKSSTTMREEKLLEEWGNKL